MEAELPRAMNYTSAVESDCIGTDKHLFKSFLQVAHLAIMHVFSVSDIFVQNMTMIRLA